MAAGIDSIRDRFSIKSFISDTPRVLNSCFKTIADCISDFWDSTTRSIKNISSIEATKVVATTVVAQNLSLKSSTGETVSYESLVKKVEDLEKMIHQVELKFISDEEIEEILDNRQL